MFNKKTKKAFPEDVIALELQKINSIDYTKVNNINASTCAITYLDNTPTYVIKTKEGLDLAINKLNNLDCEEKSMLSDIQKLDTIDFNTLGYFKLTLNLDPFSKDNLEWDDDEYNDSRKQPICDYCKLEAKFYDGLTEINTYNTNVKKLFIELLNKQKSNFNVSIPYCDKLNKINFKNIVKFQAIYNELDNQYKIKIKLVNGLNYKTNDMVKCIICINKLMENL